MGKSLFQKVWDAHVVRALDNGQAQVFIGLHLIHEVTSPQAFGMLRDLGLSVAFPQNTFATVDHIVPTDTRLRPFRDSLAEGMIVALEQACKQYGIKFFDLSSG
ncbi:MAG TPA: aconitase family protein, partial [Polyangiaceae bacterium]|nr:aconitase family protein [Polyangiaceae bacterium]